MIADMLTNTKRSPAANELFMINEIYIYIYTYICIYIYI